MKRLYNLLQIDNDPLLKHRVWYRLLRVLTYLAMIVVDVVGGLLLYVFISTDYTNFKDPIGYKYNAIFGTLVGIFFANIIVKMLFSGIVYIIAGDRASKFAWLKYTLVSCVCIVLLVFVITRNFPEVDASPINFDNQNFPVATITPIPTPTETPTPFLTPTPISTYTYPTPAPIRSNQDTNTQQQLDAQKQQLLYEQAQQEALREQQQEIQNQQQLDQINHYYQTQNCINSGQINCPL